MKGMMYAVLALAIGIQGCNTHPSKIAAMPMSEVVFERHDCKRLSKEMAMLDTMLLSQRDQLQTGANTDIAIVIGSIALLPLGLFALAATGNKDLERQYAENLGKRSALKIQMDTKEC